jgi:tRNA G37 N-methylase Trm5
MTSGPRVLELFCGIGGCAAAVDGRARVVAAVDVNPGARVSELFPRPFRFRG